MKKTFFSDFFGVDKKVMKKHRVFNISLIADTPAFIDPFNLYCSPKESYQEAHRNIIDYAKFLCKISKSKKNVGQLKRKYFYFKEPAQNWLGYTEYGNAGNGLRKAFADSLFENMSKYIRNFGYEEITDSSHVEKLCLFDDGFSMDSVSDFTTRLIYPFLLAYTEDFSRKHINRNYCKTHMVENAYFDFQKREWCSKEYYLPTFKDDYVILVPEDILVQEEPFICRSGLVEYLKYATFPVTNGKFVNHINEYISDIISEELSAEERKKKLNQLIREYPEILDYYIKSCEERSEEAVVNNQKLVAELNQIFNINCKALIELLQFQSDFYKYDDIDDIATIIRRLNILRDILETPGESQFLYFNSKPLETKTLEMLLNRVWFAGKPKGAAKRFVPYKLEFKCAANSPIEDNLYNRFIDKSDKKVNILCYVYFTDNQHKRLIDALNKLNLTNNNNIVLVDATN